MLIFNFELDYRTMDSMPRQHRIDFLYSFSDLCQIVYFWIIWKKTADEYIISGFLLWKGAD